MSHGDRSVEAEEPRAAFLDFEHAVHRGECRTVVEDGNVVEHDDAAVAVCVVDPLEDLPRLLVEPIEAFELKDAELVAGFSDGRDDGALHGLAGAGAVMPAELGRDPFVGPALRAELRGGVVPFGVVDAALEVTSGHGDLRT